MEIIDTLGPKAKKGKTKLLVSVVEWVIFIIMLLMFLVLISPALPTKRFVATYVVASGSMEPTLKIGSIVFVQPVPIESLKIGDIISFVSPTDPKSIIIHRIYSVNNVGNTLSFKTKGDNNNAKDIWDVSPLSLKGKYLVAVPYVGYITVLMKDPWMFALIIGIPALILLVFQIKKIREGIEEEIQKRVINRQN
jgi:signal peptidase I